MEQTLLASIPRQVWTLLHAVDQRAGSRCIDTCPHYIYTNTFLGFSECGKNIRAALMLVITELRNLSSLSEDAFLVQTLPHGLIGFAPG